MRGALTSGRERLAARLPTERRERVAVALLLALVAAGLALRAALTVAERPALTGFPDIGTYVDAARTNAFKDPLRTAGYPLFLRVVHLVSANLSATIVLQHLMGVAAALLLYGTVRRAGFGRFAALVPAAVILLSGSEIFLEHTPLSETLFVFLVAATLYAGARLTERPTLPWAAAAGLLAALAGSVREVGFALVPVLVLWLALASGGAWKPRLLRAGACLAAAAVLLGTYVLVNQSATGYAGITRSGSWNLYGRVAPFADCSRFTPPSGTRALCQRTPSERRPNPGAYLFTQTYSPGIKHFKGPLTATPADTRKVGAFARAALFGQPLDYLAAVGKGVLKYVAPGRNLEHEGWTYTGFFHHSLFDQYWSARVRAFSLWWYGNAGKGEHLDKRLMYHLLRYESATQLKGPLFVVLALLSLASPFLTRGRRRRAALLFCLLAWVSLILPVASLWWNARYAVAAFGPLAVSAGVGAAAVWSQLAAFRARRSARSAAVPA